MKKLLVILFGIIMLLSISLINASVQIEGNSISGYETYFINGYGWIAQSFKIGNSSENTLYQLDKVYLTGFSRDNSCLGNISIRDSLNGNDLSINNSFSLINGYINLTMPSIYLFPSKRYYIIVYPRCNNNYLGYTQSNDGYTGGNAFYEGGSGWNSYGKSTDFTFKIMATKVVNNISTTILENPLDNKISYNKNIFFSATFLSLNNNTNNTLKIWNTNSSLLNNQTNYITSNLNSSFNFYDFLNFGTYKWNYEQCDKLNCSYSNNNYTLTIKNYSIGCIPKTCIDIAWYKYFPHVCGKWSDGCGNELDCGDCSDYLKKHVYVSGCNIDCLNGQGQHTYASCDDLITKAMYYYTLPKLQNNYDRTIDFLGGYDYLKSKNYPFPDANVTLDCSAWNQYDIPDSVNVAYWDNYGQTHEFIHWMIRKYSKPSSNFYYAFEEGFTNLISYCFENPNDECCDADKGTCDNIKYPDSYWCTPGICNYQGVEAGMIAMTQTYLNCDIQHCWKWFFKNIVANKYGDTLDISDAYSFLISYSNNKTRVDEVLNKYFPYIGIDLDSISYYKYSISSDAYPSSSPINDSISPVVTLDSPIDSFTTNKSSVNFSCSATENIQLTNISIFTNISGSFVLNQTSIKTGFTNSTIFNISNIPDGYYIWNCKACDNSSNCAFSTNKTFKINTTIIDNRYPQFSGKSDNNATLINTGVGYFNITISNTNGTTYLNIDNKSILASNSSNIFNVTYQFTNYGTYTYYWSSYGDGSSKNLNNSNNYNYVVNQSIVILPSTSLIEWNNDTSVVYPVQLIVSPVGQTFKIGTKSLNQNYNLTNITMYLRYNGRENGVVWVKVFNVSNINQVLSYSQNITLSNLSSNFSWISFNMTSMLLNASQTYIIDIETNNTIWAVDSGYTNNLYPQGDLYYDWVINPLDLLFNVYGNTINNTQPLNYSNLTYTKIEWNNKSVYSHDNLNDDFFRGQTFKIGYTGLNKNYNLTNIILELSVIYSICNVTTSIRDQTMSTILSVNNSIFVNNSLTDKFYNITMPTTVLNKNTTYSIVLNTTCNVSSLPYAYVGNTQTAYNGGKGYLSTDSGRSWIPSGGHFYFEVYGYDLGGDCSPDCSCQIDTCNSLNCSNGCGGFCQGTKDCGDNGNPKGDVYPVFSNNVFNNVNISNKERGFFSIIVERTNGSVFLSIENKNISVSNITNFYSLNYDFTHNGSYDYYWFSYGNDSYENFARTITYTMNVYGETPSVNSTTTYTCNQTERIGYNIILIVSALFILAFILTFMYSRGILQEMSIAQLIIMFIGISIGLALLMATSSTISNTCNMGG
jgi:hypothetical protein